MKGIILSLILFIAFSEAVVQELSIDKIKDPCPIRMDCTLIKIACPVGTIFDNNARGCCCKPLCTGQNEVYTCGCADKVCNEPQIVCKQCLNGCFCKPGYVRHPITRKCILETKCPLPVG